MLLHYKAPLLFQSAFFDNLLETQERFRFHAILFLLAFQALLPMHNNHFDKKKFEVGNQGEYKQESRRDN